MIDATKLCQQGRRQNEFSQQNIMDIVVIFTVYFSGITASTVSDLQIHQTQHGICLPWPRSYHAPSLR